MKLRYVWTAFVIVMLVLSGCKDNVPIKTADDEQQIDNDTSKDTQQHIDEEIEKERDKIKQYMDSDMDEVIAHQNKAMETFKKAQNMDNDKERYEVFVNETLPEAKQALQAAKALKRNANPKDLDQLEDKLIKPLHTFVNMLEYKVDAMKAKSEQEKKQLEEEFEKHAQKYIEEWKAYYNKLEAIGKKYNLDINLDNMKVLKEQIERTIEMAELLHVSGDQLKQLIAFQQEALNALRHLVGDHSKSDSERIEKLKKGLFPQLDNIFEEDNKKIDRDQLGETLDQLKKATKDNLDALEMEKEGIDKNDKELIEQSQRKFIEYEKEIDEFRSNLENVKSKMDDLNKREE